MVIVVANIYVVINKKCMRKKFLKLYSLSNVFGSIYIHLI